MTETVVLTVLSTPDYDISAPVSATAYIVDNEVPNVVTLTAVDTNSFEGTPADTLTFLLTRYGDTNGSPLIDFVADAGTAVQGSDFMDLPTGVFLPAGVVTQAITVTVIDDNVPEETETVGIRLIPNGDFMAGTPDRAFGFIRDDDPPPACVLFSDDLDSDTSANWIVRFGANNGINDATTLWADDYSLRGIPSAPHSGGTTKGLFVAVNKNDGTAGGSAGINLYPTGRTFSGNYALRFDMFLSFGTAGTTEHALAGLNHSMLLTNRVTQSTDANNTTRGNDGIFVAIETDGSGNRDYGAYTSTNANSVPGLITN